MIAHQLAIFTPSQLDNYWTNRLRRYMNGRALAVGSYRAPFIASTYDAHPRQRWIARDFGPVLGKGGTGWTVPQSCEDRVHLRNSPEQMMRYFNYCVQDALNNRW